MLVLLSSVAFAAVSRSAANNVVTYTTGVATSFYKAYYAVNDIVPAGCTITQQPTCAGNYQSCSYVSSDRSLRVVGYTAEAGGSMPSSVAVTVVGTGSCTLGNFNYAESYKATSGGAAVLGSSTSVTDSDALTLSVAACSTKGDTSSPCDGKVSNQELLNYITRWVNSEVTNQDLLDSITAWSVS